MARMPRLIWTGCWIVALPLVLALASCSGSDTGTTTDNPAGNPTLTIGTEQVVNDAGGTVEADRAKIDIPPGALNGPIKVQVGKVDSPGRPPWTDRGVGFGRYFGPDGLIFNKPVVVTIPYESFDISGQGDLDRMFVFRKGAGEPTWTRLAGHQIPSGAGVVTVSTIRCSTFVLALFGTTHGYGSVAGQVTADSGAPIEGAEVAILSEGVLALTGADGRYSIPQLGPARYSADATDPAYQSVQTDVMVDASQTTTLNFSLSPTASTTGRVRAIVTTSDVTKLPVQGAAVSVSAGAAPIASGTTDATGHVDIANIPPGTYSVTVDAPRFATKTYGGVVTKVGEWTLLWAELSPSGTGAPGTLTGLVLGAGDARIAGARVEIMSGPQDLGRAATSDASGTYSFDQLQSGDYTVRVSATGYETYNSTAITVDANKETRSDFNLTPTGNANVGAIAGVVRDDPTASPLAGVDVHIIAGPHTDNPLVTTDAQGAYELANLSPGTYTLRFSKTGYQTFTTPGLVVSGGTTASYDVLLTPAGT